MEMFGDQLVVSILGVLWLLINTKNRINMPKIVELRQDRSHVRSNFDGYKLSLDSVPVLRQELGHGAWNSKPTEQQYSLLHAELFSMQNLLQSDPWARCTAYFVNCLGEVVRCGYDENSGRQENAVVVYRLKEQQRQIKGEYNCSIRFISEKYCVVCNGKRELLLLETFDRRKATEWKLIASAEISTAPDEPNFLLYDCRLDMIKERKQISLALGCVQRENDGDGAAHFLRLHWAQWVLAEADSWDFKIVETLEGKGSLYYCAFEPRAESLVISSNREFHFKSQKLQNERMELETTAEKPQLHGEAEEEYLYSWEQTAEDVVVAFAAKEGKHKADYDIKSSATLLSVKCGEDTLLERSLFAKVDADLTTWNMSNNQLEITLTKQTAVSWPALLSEGAGPKERTTEKNEAAIPIEQQPIANLEAPVEDCDFPMGTADYDIKIERFNLPSKSVTHAVLLGCTPPLFSTNLRPGFPATIATREDVDASMWLQQYNPSKPEEWSLRHEGNLHAFGYVQASKQQKKFMDCAPDLSYAVICESFRHVFLYKMNYDTANGLRNRNGPQVTLGKQHLITLENSGEVLGLATAPSVIILLTEQALLYLQIN